MIQNRGHIVIARTAEREGLVKGITGFAQFFLDSGEKRYRWLLVRKCIEHYLGHIQKQRLEGYYVRNDSFCAQNSGLSAKVSQP